MFGEIGLREEGGNGCVHFNVNVRICIHITRGKYNIDVSALSEHIRHIPT